MKKHVFFVENIKCEGCASRIENKLSSVQSIQNVSISPEQQKVEFDLDESVNIDLALDLLSKMGYPLIGNGSQLHNIKSYVSCALGRLQKN